MYKIEVEEADLDQASRNLRINLVSKIENWLNPKPTTLGCLSKEEFYDLCIDYKINGEHLYQAKGLSYKNLRDKLMAKLIAPSTMFMDIFVSRVEGDKQ